MQLFIIEKPLIHWKTIVLTDEWIVHQLGRVLRSRVWDACFLQWNEGTEVIRIQVIFEEITKKSITSGIESEERKKREHWSKRIAIARPNKPAKMELIVQKLTELWLDEIIFFKAERSQPWVWNEKKAWRIEAIVQEATEQCRWWSSPLVTYCNSIEEIVCKEVLVADIPGRLSKTFDGKFSWSELVFVWPEWGRWESDYAYFSMKNAEVIEMGNRVLRMETAAIVVGAKIMGI